MLKNTTKIGQVLIDQSTQPTIITRTYVKRMVSKSVYNQLKRQKVDWSTIRSSEILERLTNPPSLTHNDILKNDIRSLVGDMKVIQSPNTDRPIPIEDQEEAFGGAASDLMDMINRVKYDAKEEKLLKEREKKEKEEQDYLIRTGQMKSHALSARHLARKMLNRAHGRGSLTPEEMLREQTQMSGEELATKYSDIVPENIIDLPTLTRYIIQVRKNIDQVKQRSAAEEEQILMEGGHTSNSLYNTFEREELEQLHTLKYRLYKQREYLISAKDVDPRLKSKRVSRFYYQPGENTPLFDFAKMKLEEINALELQEFERQKNVVEYARLLREKDKSQIAQQLKDLDK